MDLHLGPASESLARTAPGGHKDVVLLVDSATSDDEDIDEAQESPRLRKARPPAATVAQWTQLNVCKG